IPGSPPGAVGGAGKSRQRPSGQTQSVLTSEPPPAPLSRAIIAAPARRSTRRRAWPGDVLTTAGRRRTIVSNSDEVLSSRGGRNPDRTRRPRNHALRRPHMFGVLQIIQGPDKGQNFVFGKHK